MLYRLEIENFYSIGERQEIDLRVRKSAKDPLGRLSPIYNGAVERAPNVVALFGPNAAGKSNVLRSIAFGAWFASNSFKHLSARALPYEKFGSHKKISEETRLSYFFGWPVDINDDSGNSRECPYKYEVVFSPRNDQSDNTILEKLSYQPNRKGKYSFIFERDSKNNVNFSKNFIDKGTERALKSILRANASVISTLAQLNHKTSIKFSSSISSVLSNIMIDRIESNDSALVNFYASHPDSLIRLQDVARRIDLGIDQIEIDQQTSDPQLFFRHVGLDQVIRFDRESHGTQNFIKIFPYILMALEQGGIAIVDEIDTAIHPMLLPEIIRWFNDEKRNPYGAQIWTTCHSASLLTDLIKEEVILCEKDSLGYTSVYNLSDVENVRRNENFLGKYLGGEYGAVPVVG